MAIIQFNTKTVRRVPGTPAPGKRGFALFIAVVFMAVMLSFGLSLGSLGYKQQVLASSALASQHAFYAADTGLECALEADNQQNLFAYDTHNSPQQLVCDGHNTTIDSGPPTEPHCFNSNACKNQWVSTTRISLDSGTRCVDVTVYKPEPPKKNSPLKTYTYIFSQGYDVPCTTVANPGDARYVSRGIDIHY